MSIEGVIALAVATTLLIIFVNEWQKDKATHRQVELARSGWLAMEIANAKPPVTELPPYQSRAPEPAMAMASVRFLVGKGIARRMTRAQVIKAGWGYQQGGNYTRAGALVDEIAKSFGWLSGYPDWNELDRIEKATTLVVKDRNGARRIAADD